MSGHEPSARNKGEFRFMNHMVQYRHGSNTIPKINKESGVLGERSTTFP